MDHVSTPIRESILFKPIQVGLNTIQQRIAMAPLTRNRATDDNVPGPLAKEYYMQRASAPGTLLFTEGTFVSPLAGGIGNGPGIWNDAQVAAWKDIVDGVHSKGSFIINQLYGAGRANTEPSVTELLAPSAIPMNATSPTPRELTEAEIWQIIDDFTQAARNAVEKAGFDGVEIHGSYGHLINQFLDENSNQRTDAWGGSIEKRARFCLEVAKSVIRAVGKERVGFRFTPFGTYQLGPLKNTIPQYSYIIKELKKLGGSHLHLVEARNDGTVDISSPHSLDPLTAIWLENQQAPLFLAGGYEPSNVQQAVEHKYKGKDVVIVFGRYFISNPDLIYRIKNDIPFTNFLRKVFYTPKSPEGYIDYPFSQEFLVEQLKA
jgi:NADPH2 dehydrogenase